MKYAIKYAIKGKQLGTAPGRCWYNPNNSIFWGVKPKTWKTRKGVERAFDKYKGWWMDTTNLSSGFQRDEKTFYERFEIVEMDENV